MQVTSGFHFTGNFIKVLRYQTKLKGGVRNRFSTRYGKGMGITMNTKWNLDVIYEGIDTAKYKADFAAFNDSIKELEDYLSKCDNEPDAQKAYRIIELMDRQTSLYVKMAFYVELRESVNTEDGELMAEESRLMRAYSEGTATNTKAMKILGSMGDTAFLIAQNPKLTPYEFILKDCKNKMKYLLADDVEAIAAAMDNFGGNAWGNLQSYLTSTVKADYDGRQITLSEVRNLAYDKDADVRKRAYETELAAYKKIEDSVAFALNNIKGQVSLLCKKRGYKSGLDQALDASRMERKTLDALMDTVKDYMPVFRKYLRKKASLLGYSGGLPWYELFAPIGKLDKKYTVEEARDYLVNTFKDFTPEMSNMMAKAFDDEWIDFFPANGKTGGAFCSGIASIKQSRILTNFDGTFSAIDTLAHELGHAFHDEQIFNEPVILQDYPMPVAETASTFNEVFLCTHALEMATDPEEKKALLESNLMETCQCVCDIYSRYLFETAVFNNCEDKFMMADELNEIMLDCQKKSYGDGLDMDYLNPGMWICKSHYYSSGLSFYNFPYAFGNLFAEGLYALYKEEGGERFVPKYKEMLRLSTVSTIEEDGLRMGIDLTDKSFWKKSLDEIADKIEEYCKL